MQRGCQKFGLRIVNSAAQPGLRLARIGASGERHSERRDIRSQRLFIDEIRGKEATKTLLMKFRADKATYLTRDIMSFLASQAQLMYPEFKCAGVLA